MGMKILRVSGEMLTELFTTGAVIPPHGTLAVEVIEGLPPGATLTGVSDLHAFTTNEVAFRYEHPDWPENTGNPLDEVRVVLTARREADAVADLRAKVLESRGMYRVAVERMEKATRMMRAAGDDRSAAVQEWHVARVDLSRAEHRYREDAVALAESL